MLVIKAGFEHGRRFCYFPTPLEPSPCDSPPLHPGKLSAWTAANKNSPVRGKWGPASARRSWWGDTSLCISSRPPHPMHSTTPPHPDHIICIICKWGEHGHSAGRGQLEMNVAEKEERGSEVEVQRQEGRGGEGEATGGTSVPLVMSLVTSGIKTPPTFRAATVISVKWFIPKCFGLCACKANHLDLQMKHFAQHTSWDELSSINNCILESHV